MLEIRATHNQIGMTIEARKDSASEWQTVQLSRYVNRSSSTVLQYSTCIDPLQDEREYFAEINSRGIQYRKVSA